MPKKRKRPQNKNARHRRSAVRGIAHEERLREEHARIVVQRSGDPRFVQRRRHEDGGTILNWAGDSEVGREILEAIAAQRGAFQAKFGRQPGPDDPIFFDPNSDEPTPFNDRSWSEHMSRVAAVAEGSGVPPAYVHAWAEVGYIVTDTNRHLFSAAQVETYLKSVSRHLEDGSDADVDLPDGQPRSMTDVTDELRDVAEEILKRRDPRPAWRLAASMSEVDDPELRELLPGAATAMLLAGLSDARTEIGPTGAMTAMSWVREHLGDEAAGLAIVAAGVLRHPDAPRLTVRQATERLGDATLPALLWLTAGVLASRSRPEQSGTPAI